MEVNIHCIVLIERLRSILICSGTMFMKYMLCSWASNLSNILYRWCLIDTVGSCSVRLSRVCMFWLFRQDSNLMSRLRKFFSPHLSIHLHSLGTLLNFGTSSMEKYIICILASVNLNTSCQDSSQNSFHRVNKFGLLRLLHMRCMC